MNMETKFYGIMGETSYPACFHDVKISGLQLPVSIFQLQKSNQEDTTWVPVAAESLYIHDHATHLSFHTRHNIPVGELLKENVTKQDATSFLGVGRTPLGECWLALRFFMHKDALEFCSLLESPSQEEPKKRQMRRRMQYVVEVDRLEQALSPLFTKFNRENHLKGFCEELAPFLSDCERPTYRRPSKFCKTTSLGGP